MNNKIYLGNLPYNLSEQDIEEGFSQFGAIEDVALIKDRNTGRPKGFGFVTFGSEEAAQNSLQMDGKDFHGRSIRVNIAKERERR